MSAYFVAATGTNIGKTFTTCALLHAARNGGVTAHGYKPIISGYNDGEENDTTQILQASGTKLPIEAISPWRFTMPVAPHRAAAYEGKSLSFDIVADWVKQRAAEPGLTLIEGVGGVMVPVNEHYTTLDLMQVAGLPVILVVGSYLGTISHTLTALKALHAEGIEVAALVMNESAEAEMPLDEAWAGLEPFVGYIPRCITQPRVAGWQSAWATADLVKQL